MMPRWDIRCSGRDAFKRYFDEIKTTIPHERRPSGMARDPQQRLTDPNRRDDELGEGSGR